MDWANAIYYSSVVLSAILDSNLETKLRGNTITIILKVVRDLIQKVFDLLQHP